MNLACSVVIPSFNRVQQLDTLLSALAAQDTEEPFEVIVVLDGSTDGSRRLMERWEEIGLFASFRWVEQPQKGQAAARNLGAFLARAPLLLFLDDDIVPDGNLISVHLAHHKAGEAIAVLGDCEIVRDEDRSFPEILLWSWYEDTFHRRATAWQPVSYRDFLTGNVSVRREDFARAGGFDQDFTRYGGEDYELGYRLLLAGVRFVADRSARARHFNKASVPKILEAARNGAHGNVLIAQKHPELIPGLSLDGPRELRLRIAAGLAFYAPVVGWFLQAIIRGKLKLLERFGFYRRWLRSLTVIRTYAYWRGLRESAGSMRDLRLIRQSAPPRLQQVIDVSVDLGFQVRALTVDIPSTILIVHAREVIGALDLHAHIEEPLLPWIVREMSSQLKDPLMLGLAASVLPTPIATPGDGRVFETG